MSWSNGQNVCVWKTLTFRYICLWATKKMTHAYLTQSGWSGSNIRWWCCCGTFPCHIGIFHCHSGSKRKWSLWTRRVLFPLSWKTCLLRRVWLGKPIPDLRTWIFRLPCMMIKWNKNKYTHYTQTVWITKKLWYHLNIHIKEASLTFFLAQDKSYTTVSEEAEMETKHPLLSLLLCKS